MNRKNKILIAITTAVALTSASKLVSELFKNENIAKEAFKASNFQSYSNVIQDVETESYSNQLYNSSLSNILDQINNNASETANKENEVDAIEKDPEKGEVQEDAINKNPETGLDVETKPEELPNGNDSTVSDAPGVKEAVSYDSKRIDLWAVIAGLGIAVVASTGVLIKRIKKAATRGAAVRKSGTELNINGSKLQEKISKVQTKINELDINSKKAKKLENKKLKLEEKYNLTKNIYQNPKLLYNYANNAIETANLIAGRNKEYFDQIDAKNYIKLMKGIKHYSKATILKNNEKEKKSNNQLKKALSYLNDVNLKSFNTYYGKNVINDSNISGLNKTLPIFPQRYVYTQDEGCPKEIQKSFDEIVSTYSKLEKKAYYVKISYENNKSKNSIHYGFDNELGAKKLKEKLISYLKAKNSTNIEITEIIREPRKIHQPVVTKVIDTVPSINKNSENKNRILPLNFNKKIKTNKKIAELDM